MTSTYPITPPPELVQQWRVEAANRQYVSLEFDEYIAEEAAQWGADQELEACCEWLKRKGWEYCPDPLRAARRPKPPSLKEQALEIIDDSIEDGPGRVLFALDEINTIRRALEQLPN